MIGNLNITPSDLNRLQRIQDIMNNQELGVTMIREKINPLYPIRHPDHHQPFELGKAY
jgi:hypothetical protein